MTAHVLCGRSAGMTSPSPVLASPRLTTNGRSTLAQSSLQGQRLCSAARPAGSSRVAASGRVYASVVGDVGTYLADAAKQVFSPTKTNTPPNWSGTGTGFSGKVSHHEAARLRDLYSLLRQARVGLTGCTDPKAENYDVNAESDDGSCTFIAEDGQVVGQGPDLRGYVTTMLSRVWGSANTNAASETTFKGKGYPFSGDIVSRRDIERLVRYEKIVKKELEKVEEEGKTPVA